ncbi:hypothetical protein [Pseudobdellovibrio sp. HCB154]|uniref:hypothetical protein n=1 Tax=Pseudobdellovibrio sp. HCB154 TaxID=3386277 RepID=UPI003917599D
MSRLDELKDQLKTSLQTTWERIQESEAYNQLNDKYQNLSPSGQKVAQVVTAILLAGIVFYSPISQLQVSGELLTQFEEKRTLIRDLFKTYRDSSGGLQMAPAPQAGELISTVQNSLSSSKLIPEQIVSVNTTQAEGRLIPANLQQAVIEVKLAKLNLRQIVDIGAQLANISQAVKVKDMFMQANAELAGYFDVTYKLYALKVPEPLPEPAPEPVNTKKKKPSEGEE